MMKYIVACCARFPVRLIYNIIFGSALSAWFLLKSIAMTLKQL